MSTDIIQSNFAQYIYHAGRRHGGGQVQFRFPNGWGASVIRNETSYGGDEGLWELAVLRPTDGTWDLHYDNPVAQGDVRGWLTSSDVEELLTQLFNFPASEEELHYLPAPEEEEQHEEPQS